MERRYQGRSLSSDNVHGNSSLVTRPVTANNAKSGKDRLRYRYMDINLDTDIDIDMDTDIDI